MRLSYVEEYRGVLRDPRGDESAATATLRLSSVEVRLGGVRFDVAGICTVEALALRDAALLGTATFHGGGCAYELRVDAPSLRLTGEKRGFGVAFVAALTTLALRVRDPAGEVAGLLLLRWDPRGGLGRLRARLSW